MGDHEVVLVVDYDEDCARCVGETLSSKGFRLVFCKNGNEAVRFSAERRPIVVFIDLKMALTNSGEFLHQFRAFQPFVPVVVMSNPGESDDLIAAFHYGVAEHLLKPFVPEAVRGALARALREDDTAFEKALLAIAARLRETRRRMGLKQSVVAVRSGLSVAQICQIENRTSSPSLESLLRICRALRTPIGEIVAGI